MGTPKVKVPLTFSSKEKSQFANALKGNKQGNPIVLNDVSPIAHGIACKVERNLESVEGVEVNVLGKNLLPPDFILTEQTTNGVHIVNNGDGSITLDGTATSPISIYLRNSKTEWLEGFQAGQTITVSKNANDESQQANCYFCCNFYDRDTGAATQGAVATNVKSGFIVIKENWVGAAIYVHVPKDKTVNNLTLYPQIEIGATATPYEPYKEPIAYTTDAAGAVSIPHTVEPMTLSAETGALMNVEYNRDINELKDLPEYVKKTDYATKYQGGVVKAENSSESTKGVYISSEGILALRQAREAEIDAKTHPYFPITPQNLDYAVKAGLVSNKLTLTDSEKKSALQWLGAEERIASIEALLDKADDVVIESHIEMDDLGEIIAVVDNPSSMQQYAQLLEVHGHEIVYDDEHGIQYILPNYPTIITTDTGTILFQLTTTLPHFGIQGNYIYFEGDKVYYKQTTKQEDYMSYELAFGEKEVARYPDTTLIIALSAPIVTDITDKLPIDPVFDRTLCNRILSGNNLVTYSDADSMRYEAGGSNVDYGTIKFKIAFEKA